jgi:hypothetical protein
MRRLRDHLPPEKTRDIAPLGARDVAIRDIQVRIPIEIEVPGIGGPRPAPHLHTGIHRDVLKCAVALVPIERIASHVPVVKIADCIGLARMKMGIFKNPHASRDPHASRVDVLSGGIVEVEPAGAHSGSRFVYVGLAGGRGESSVALIAIQIVSAKIIHYVQVRPPISVAVAPRTSETVAVVLDVQARSFRSVLENAIPLVVEEIIRGAVTRVEIRHRIPILVESLIVVVQTEVDVEASIAIIVGNRSMSECALWRTRKVKCVAFERILPVSLVRKEQGARCAYDEKVL